MSQEVDTADARRRKAFMVAQQIGLSRNDRLELAEYILRRDVRSWKDLDDIQISRLLDAMEGFELITEQLSFPRPAPRVARVSPQTS